MQTMFASSKKRCGSILRSGTSYEEIWACAAAAYCYMIKQKQKIGSQLTTRSGKTIYRGAHIPTYDDFRRAHLPRGIRPEPDLLIDGSMVFQYDGNYFHADRVHRDIEINRKHSSQGYRVVRLRDRLAPIPGCENIVTGTPSLEAVQRDIFLHFNAMDQYTTVARDTVALWARKRIDELARHAEGRDKGLQWIRTNVLQPNELFDERWRCVRFEDDFVYRAHKLLYASVGRDAYMAAMRSPLCCSLHQKSILREIKWWIEQIGERRFVTLMDRRGIAGGLGRPAFRSRLRGWFMKIGAPHTFTAWACNSVASRLEHPAFNRFMNQWLRDLGPNLLSKWMCDGVASRMENPVFNQRARLWLRRLSAAYGPKDGRECFAAWMNNSVARRLGDARFERVAQEWLKMVPSSAQYATIFHGSFVSRLHSETFEKRARDAFNKMGAAAFVTYVNRHRGRKMDRAFHHVS